MKFKSYYVVWKLIQMTEIENIAQGLNRTMQYGNKYVQKEIANINLSLNRTMQYGNLEEAPEYQISAVV